MSWAMTMRWHDLLFAHWPVPVEALRGRIPAELELDTFEGEAWLGLVPFRMTGVRLRWLPPLPTTGSFAELNVRTYVRCGDLSGVWFFSLDAASALAVAGARAWFGLPYFRARIAVAGAGAGDETPLAYRSTRTHRGAEPTELDATYRPTGPVARTAPGTLEHWLTERYLLFASHPLRGLMQGRVHHEPWPLQPAELELRRNTMASPLGLELGDRPPLVHFSRSLDVKADAPGPLRK